jgi:arylsulfate sulfotransferase
MGKRQQSLILLSTMIGVMALVTGCGGGGNSILIAPGQAALVTGQAVQFSANVQGSSDSTVTWSVNGVVGGSSATGTITAAGLYAAPPTLSEPATFTIRAVSNANSSLSASAKAWVYLPGSVSSTNNPQVALYSMPAPADASVEVDFGPDTNYGLKTGSQPSPAGGGAMDMLVAGMRAFTTYHMRASVQLPSGLQYFDQDQVFTTGGLPAARLPQVTVAEPTAGLTPAPGVELLALTPGTSSQIEAAVLDLQGEVIWYYDFANTTGRLFPFPIKLLPNGHMKIVIGGVTFGPTNLVREIDLAGNTISELTPAELNTALAAAGSPIVSQGFHHDFVLLPNGDTMYLVFETKTFTDLPGFPGATNVIGDALVEVAPDGSVVWTWSTFDHLDVNYHPLSFPDWTHSNAVIYSSSDGNLVLSSRDLSWVMKINYQDGAGNGDILWKLGPNGDFTLVNGKPSDWFYNQHFPIFLSPNTDGSFQLGVWDNGNTRPDPTSGLPCEDEHANPAGGACYSRGLILNVDENAKTAEIAFQDQVPGVPPSTAPGFAFCCGNINILSNGDVEMGEGGLSLFVPPFATGVSEVTNSATPQSVWQLTVEGQASYRAFRIPSLYPGVTWNTSP